MLKKTIQLNLNGLLPVNRTALRQAASHFKKHDFVKLPLFFSQDILTFAVQKIEQAAFASKKHKDIATELCMKTNALVRMLTFLMNDYRLFDFIRQITACGPLGCFTGRIYRMQAGNHYDSWHDDWLYDRKIAVSVNLSGGVYKGGCLMLRYKKNPSRIRLASNVGFGDAVVFRLGSELEHQVSPLEGSIPKTAYAGWFRSKPDYLKSIKKMKRQVAGSF